jgi:hypothetical protein
MLKSLHSLSLSLTVLSLTLSHSTDLFDDHRESKNSECRRMIASSYTLLNRILSELEETLVPPCLPHSPLLSVSFCRPQTEYAQWVQRKHLATSSNGSMDSEEAIGLFDDDLRPEAENAGANNSGRMAMGMMERMVTIRRRLK